MVGNWNACLNEATGDWFVLLSDDDLIDHDFVESFGYALETSENIDLLFMRCRIINKITNLNDDNLPPTFMRGELNIFEHLIEPWIKGRFTLPLAGIIFRTSVLKGCIGFSNRLPHAADVATWLPISATHRCGFWPDAKISYVFHDGMTTQSTLAETLLNDAFEISSMLGAISGQVQNIGAEKLKQLKKLPRIHLVDRFNNIMISSARKGTSKRQLLSFWLRFGARIPYFGLGILSLSAILVPFRLIPIIGWPYRQFFLLRKKNYLR